MPSGNISLESYSDIIYIGFLYKAEAGDDFVTYEVDDIKLGVSGGDTPEPPAPSGDIKFRKATSIISGNSYVLVVDNQVGTSIGETLSYGRLSMSAVSISGNEFTTSASNAIVITAVNGGYTMVDSFGRYLSMDSNPSHQSTFQLFSSQETGSVWSISVDADGVAVITNNLNPTCNVVRSSTFTNIAPSDIEKYTQFDRPVLYEICLLYTSPSPRD